MKLGQLLRSLGSCEVYPAQADFEISGISCDSKTVGDGYIFVAIKGTHQDGHKFITEAIVKGARAIVVEGKLIQEFTDPRAIFIVTSCTRKALAVLAAEFYGRPSDKLKVIGITGTNGKTTITYLIEAILTKALKHPAVIGTINYRFQGNVIQSTNTTPGSRDLQFMLKKMLDAGADYAVMEVSSHALDQDRVEAINFHAAIFTNLTQDHLDYHKTLENYFQAKSRLFQNLGPGAIAAINNDDEYGRKLIKLTKARVVTYGIKYNVDVSAQDIRFGAEHTDFILKVGTKLVNFKTPLIGRHNVYNMLASIAVAFYAGFDLDLIKTALEEFVFVPGRLERIETGRDFSVFVDYAHTEDALRNVISTLREISRGKIIVVFGCGGERDRQKRPKMGAVVTDLADYAVITSDNPRSEDPLVIINEIKAGIKKNNYCVIPDRKEAINKSLALAKAGDIVLVAGKGHENYQVLKDQSLHFDDREVVKQCLQ